MVKKDSFSQQTFPGTIIATGIFSILLGILVLVGYQYNIVSLKSVTPFWLNMKANTAICFILAGIALLCLRKENAKHSYKTLGYVCAGIITASSLVTMTEYIFGLNFGVDQLFFIEAPHIEDILFPGRASFATTCCLFLLGMSFFLIDAKFIDRGFYQVLSLLILLIASFGLLGYFYNINTVYGFTYFIKMALHTSIGFILLSIAIILARPKVGVTKSLLAKTPGGDLLRSLIPYMFIIPLLVGFLENLGERVNLYGAAFGDNLQVTLTIVPLMWVVYIYAKKMDKK